MSSHRYGKKKKLMAEIADIKREKQADLEHEQWAHWTRFMLKALGLWDLTEKELLNLTLDTSEGAVKKAMFDRKQVTSLLQWRRQCETPYADLSKKEKDSDREWADKAIAILLP